MATLKQKKAVKKIAENGGNVSKAMREAGYSKISAATPKKLTQSKGFKELLDEYLPDTLLTKKHKELLTVPIKVKTRTRKAGQVVYEETIEAVDTFAISKGLDMAYKLKGSYAPEKKELSGGLNLTQLCNSADDK